MSKKEEKATEGFELLFTKADAAVITARADERGIVCDLDYLQEEVDKLVKQWRDEPSFY